MDLPFARLFEEHRLPSPQRGRGVGGEGEARCKRNTRCKNPPEVPPCPRADDRFPLVAAYRSPLATLHSSLSFASCDAVLPDGSITIGCDFPSSLPSALPTRTTEAGWSIVEVTLTTAVVALP